MEKRFGKANIHRCHHQYFDAQLVLLYILSSTCCQNNWNSCSEDFQHIFYHICQIRLAYCQYHYPDRRNQMPISLHRFFYHRKRADWEELRKRHLEPELNRPISQYLLNYSYRFISTKKIPNFLIITTILISFTIYLHNSVSNRCMRL